MKTLKPNNNQKLFVTQTIPKRMPKYLPNGLDSTCFQTLEEPFRSITVITGNHSPNLQKVDQNSALAHSLAAYYNIYTTNIQ